MNASPANPSSALLKFELSLTVRGRDKDPPFRELLKDRLRLAEVIGKQIGRGAGHPLGQVDRLIVPCVQADQEPAGLLPMFSIEWP